MSRLIYIRASFNQGGVEKNYNAFFFSLVHLLVQRFDVNANQAKKFILKWKNDLS